MIGDKSKSAHNRAVTHFNRGILYASKGDMNRAIADFRKAAGLGHPRAGEALRKLGATP